MYVRLRTKSSFIEKKQLAKALVDDLFNFNKITHVTVGWPQVNEIRQNWQRRGSNDSGNQGYRDRYSVSISMLSI